MTRLCATIDGDVLLDEEDTRATVHRILRARGVWDDFCHWSSMWMMMPEVAYRLARCITTSVPDARGRGPLLGQCFVDAAAVIRRWPTSDSTMVLVAEAVRAMFRRALEASAYVVLLPDERQWRPDVHGPLADCIAELKASVVTVYRREQEQGDAQAAMHRLLERHVYCIRCSINLRQSYAQLMGVAGDL